MAQHRNKHAALQAATANRLKDGETVYFTQSGEWAESLAQAEQARGADAGAALLARAQAAGETVIEPYLFELKEEGKGTHPASMRERIRAVGPTTHDAFSKQARS